MRNIGDWRNNKDQIKAGKIALKLRKECVEKNIIKAIKEIKEKGYIIHLYYVGVNSPEIAKQRVKDRVKKGGHDIPEDVIEKRYIENLEAILPLVDYAKIYDNSGIYKLCYTKFGSEYIKVCEEVPEWLKQILK